MRSHRDTNSDVPTEQSTSYFNASFFPESNHYHTENDDILDANYFNAHFEEGAVAAFQPPPSYDNHRRRTDAERNNAPTQGLILGSTSALYQPYYPTEEVPITEGLGTDLVNWKLCSRNSSSYTGSRTRTSGHRSSKNGQTPPTVCETATIVNGAQTEFDFNGDIDLDEVRKQDFTYLPRFNKQKDIINHVENATQKTGASDQGQYPSLASTSSFFPAWEMQSVQNPHIEDPVLNEVGVQLAYDGNSTVSKSQTQSSVFTGGNRRAAGTAPSVTSYTESSIADSALSEQFNAFKAQGMPSYPKYINDDGFNAISGYNGYDSLANEYAQYSMVPPNLQQALDAVLDDFNASISSQSMAPTPLTTSFHPYTQSQAKRHQSFSPSPQSPKRRTKKDHICHTCNASFTEKTNLTRHVKSRKCTNNGPDMFSCPVDDCPRSYEGRSDNLKTHMKRMHRREWNKLKTFQGDWREKQSLQSWLSVMA